MKASTYNSKSVIISISLLLLMQSCGVYHSNGVSLDDAVASKNKILIQQKDGSKLKYSKVKKVDGKYFGAKCSDEKQLIPIDEHNIDKVRVRNTGLSALATLGIITATLAAISTVVVVAANQNIQE